MSAREGSIARLDRAFNGSNCCFSVSSRSSRVAGDRPWAESGRPLRFYPTANAEASALRYLIDPAEQLRILLEIDDRDEAIWGIFHSHTHTAVEPSPTDRRQAFYPGTLYVIASLADPQDLHIRAWLLDGDEAREVPPRVG